MKWKLRERRLCVSVVLNWLCVLEKHEYLNGMCVRVCVLRTDYALVRILLIFHIRKVSRFVCGKYLKYQYTRWATQKMSSVKTEEMNDIKYDLKCSTEVYTCTHMKSNIVRDLFSANRQGHNICRE